MTNIPKHITIDGPAGAGKSTLGELLARRLGYLYFDTGVMYRALTLAAIERGVDPADGTALAELAQRVDMSVTQPEIDDGRQYTVLLDSRDVTWEIRRPEVEQHVSLVARHPEVRAIMRERQRAIGLQGKVVMVGRDIGRIVMPDAALKIYLRASLDKRAERRARELHARGQEADFAAIRSDVERRDQLDQHVMEPAPDALVLDCEHLSPEQEVEAIMAYIEQNNPHVRAQLAMEMQRS